MPRKCLPSCFYNLGAAFALSVIVSTSFTISAPAETAIAAPSPIISEAATSDFIELAQATEIKEIKETTEIKAEEAARKREEKRAERERKRAERAAKRKKRKPIVRFGSYH